MSEGGKGNGVDLGAIYGAIMALDRKVERGLAELRHEVRQDIAALRSEVATYHASVVGHGVLLSEHEDRIGRLERGEPPPKAA